MCNDSSKRFIFNKKIKDNRMSVILTRRVQDQTKKERGIGFGSGMYEFYILGTSFETPWMDTDNKSGE
jgi:hypothetical protein